MFFMRLWMSNARFRKRCYVYAQEQTLALSGTQRYLGCSCKTKALPRRCPAERQCVSSGSPRAFFGQQPATCKYHCSAIKALSWKYHWRTYKYHCAGDYTCIALEYDMQTFQTEAWLGEMRHDCACSAVRFSGKALSSVLMDRVDCTSFLLPLNIFSSCMMDTARLARCWIATQLHRHLARILYRPLCAIKLQEIVLWFA